VHKENAPIGDATNTAKLELVGLELGGSRGAKAGVLAHFAL
jgi:hypothetical protein